jgi:hypothetical protein
VYYIRQEGSDVWWGAMSTVSTVEYLDFFKGVAFTNVFHGIRSGALVTGNWVDVPRGDTLSGGTLTLNILPDYPAGLALRKVSETGGFGANVWHNSVVATPPNQCTTAPDYLRCAFDKIRKNDGTTLYDNLKPEKDFAVIFGWVTEGLSLNYPPGFGRTYTDFRLAPSFGGDGDLTFNIQVDLASPGLSETGWEYPDGPSVVRSKLRANQLQLHSEVIMYGRSDGNHPPLMPGWMETDANSTLWNGTPINGFVQEGPPASIGGAVLTPGSRIRVIGVLSLDCGHFPYDCENDDPAEIHPVYSIDIVQDWTHRLQTANLTGTWAGSDAGTYYLRQVGNTVWWLGLSRDQGRTFANVFEGTIATENIEGGLRRVIKGEWADIPLGSTLSSGTLDLWGTLCLPNGCDVRAPIALYNSLGVWGESGGFGGQGFEKLYDRGQPPTVP